MARTSITNNKADFLLHTVAVSYRAYGSGNLRTTLFSLQDVTSDVLAPIPLAAATNKFPTVIANFSDQRTQIQFQVTSYDETFTIAKITAFAKPTATGYPQL